MRIRDVASLAVFIALAGCGDPEPSVGPIGGGVDVSGVEQEVATEPDIQEPVALPDGLEEAPTDAVVVAPDAVIIGVNRRATFALPDGQENVPYCVQVSTPDGTPITGAKVEVRDAGGDLVQGVFAPDSVATPAFNTDADGRVYFNLRSDHPREVFPEFHVYAGGQLFIAQIGTGPAPGASIFTDSADELNADFPLANTPFPLGICLEPAS